jgi:hypothetical protein
MSYDIVIIHGVKDSEILPYTINSIKKHVKQYNKIYIISQDASISLFKEDIFKDCIVIDEKENSFFNIEDVNKIIKTPSRNGWYFQQLLKLYASYIIVDLLDDYVVIDSDTIFLKDISFKQGERYIFNTATENHIPYFEHMSRLHHSLRRVVPSLSGVCHHMIFNRHIILALFSLVSQSNPIEFWKVFLEQVDPSQYQHSGASEYEIYFNFMLLYYKSSVFLRTIKFENTGLDPNIAINNYANSDIYYVSIHSWMRPSRPISTEPPIYFGISNISKNNIISGENFQELCDISIITHEIENFHRSLPPVNKLYIDDFMSDISSFDINKLKYYKSFFVYTHILDLFVQHILPFINHSIVLVTHNSDHPINEKYIFLLNSSKIEKIYAQNIEINHYKLVGIPIGIANSQWAHGNKEIVSYVSSIIHRFPHNLRKENVYVNFTIGTFQTHRNNVYNKLKNQSFTTFSNPKDIVGYWNDLLVHKWVACPRGNGVDTHRLWEALYAGCIPLVDRSICSEAFKDLPIIYIDDWSNITLDWLRLETDKIVFNKSKLNFSQLLMSDWKSKIPKYYSEGDFVLCYIGQLPKYTEDCIKQIRLWNPTYVDELQNLKPQIYICTSETNENKKLLTHLVSEYNVTPVFIEKLQKTKDHAIFSNSYSNMSMNGFWKYTTERFFILEECMRKYHLKNVCHIEIDNLIYFNLQENLSKFKSLDSILVPSDNETRFIAGICFVNDVKYLQELNQYFAHRSHNRAEMEVMMEFNRHTNYIKTLPVIMPEYSEQLRPQEGNPIHNPSRFSELILSFNQPDGCIFDAAAIGQYMFGIDTIHNINNTDGFINPHCCFRIDKCKLKWEKYNGLYRLNISQNGDYWYPIYNLHVHNKSLDRGLSNQVNNDKLPQHLTNLEIK